MKEQTVRFAVRRSFPRAAFSLFTERQLMLGLINDTGIVVLIVAFVLLFGASQIPKVARNIAEAGKEFRKAHAELEETSTTPPRNSFLSNRAETGGSQGA
jgi:TatA/E family protein of Tat protein translocase